MAEGEPWSDDENDRLVRAYFDMLALDIARRDAGQGSRVVNKMQVYREFGGRNVKSVEAKMQNVSAILQLIGVPTVEGLKGRSNYQHSLVDAIERMRHRLDDIPMGLDSIRDVIEVDAPAFSPSNRDVPDFVNELIRKIDPAERDERN